MINKRWLSLGLSLLGVLGVGGTAFVAVKCSKVSDKKETKKEKILAYAPAVVVGVGTGAAIMGSHYVSRQEIIALTATCGYLVSNRDKIEKKVRELIGDEKTKELVGEVAKEEVKVAGTPWDNIKWTEKKGVTVEYTGRGNEKFMDWYSGRQFYSSYRDVSEGIRKLNYDFHTGKYVCYNDLYEYWGIEKTQFGEQFGWPANEYYDYSIDEPIPFDIVHVNIGEEDDMYVIQHRGTPPMEFWMEV